MGVWLVLLAGCGDRATLIVQVRTDLIPVTEFARIEVTATLDGTPRRVGVDATEQRAWGTGVRVAEIADLPAETVIVEVTARGPGGEVVVSRPVRVALTSGLEVVTVLLTRDCVGVECPLVGGDPALAACLAGRCVLTECREEEGASCGEPACASAADCPTATDACSAAECTPSGACFAAPDHTACADAEQCVTGRGCEAACVPSDTFGPPALVTGLGTSHFLLEEASFSSDGQTVHYGAEGPARIFAATRDAMGRYVDDRELVELVVPPLTITDGPSLRGDQLEIVFRGYDDQDDLYSAVRVSASDPFGPSRRMTEVNGGAAEFCPELSDDGLELFFTSSRVGPSRLFHATRERTSDVFSAPTMIDELAGTEEACPSIAEDRLTLAFERDGDIYLARRPSTTEPFEMIRALDELNSPGLDGAPELFENGLAIAFTSHRTGAAAFYVARRGCVP